MRRYCRDGVEGVAWCMAGYDAGCGGRCRGCGVRYGGGVWGITGCDVVSQGAVECEPERSVEGWWREVWGYERRGI